MNFRGGLVNNRCMVSSKGSRQMSLGCVIGLLKWEKAAAGVWLESHGRAILKNFVARLRSGTSLRVVGLSCSDAPGPGVRAQMSQLV